ncbi:EboA domain-containing protein [Parapedobacter sp. DT-150]|uniref:EboA domain-containing protein n=1 Tax=Parapedobacter sp. DT-150 TaxID=3396162 RepID=UPI003F1A3D54
MDRLQGDSQEARRAMGNVIGDTIKQHIQRDEWEWLSEQVAQVAADPQPGRVARSFTALPRQIRSANKMLPISLGAISQGSHQLPLLVSHWPLVRLARVWVLMAIPKLEEEAYVQLIEQLFAYGEMEELAALYAALPVYHYPEAWQSRCKEGIRSNVGPARQAVMLHNPYPSRFLDEGAWNQLVLKAFFTEENILEIIGLVPRNNPRLAQALVDYAYERYAAKREIDPLLWILVAPFMDERAYHLMAQVLKESQALLERKAIAYAFKQSGFDPAVAYIDGNDEAMEWSDATDTPWEDWPQGFEKYDHH